MDRPPSPAPSTSISEYHERYADKVVADVETDERTESLLDDTLRCLKDLSSKDRSELVMKFYSDVMYRLHAPPEKAPYCGKCGKVMRDARFPICFICKYKNCVKCGDKMLADSPYISCFTCNSKVEKKMCVVCRRPKVKADSKFTKCFDCSR